MTVPSVGDNQLSSEIGHEALFADIVPSKTLEIGHQCEKLRTSVVVQVVIGNRPILPCHHRRRSDPCGSRGRPCLEGSTPS